MDALRFGVLEQQQRAAHMTFEGRPLRLFDSNVSLPPPPPKPPKTQTKKAPPPNPVEGHATGKVTDETKDAIRAMLARGLPMPVIARQAGVSVKTVSRVKHPKTTAKAQAAACAVDVWQVREQQQPPVQAEAPAPAPACEAAGPLAEPARMHILDWCKRMAGYDFSAAPAHCQPKKARTYGRGLTHYQINVALRSDHAPTIGMSINSRPRVSVSAIAQSIAQIFA